MSFLRAPIWPSVPDLQPDEVIPVYHPKSYWEDGFVWYWDVDVEPLLQSVVAIGSTSALPKYYDHSTAKTFLELICADFLKKRYSLHPDPAIGRTYKGILVDRNVLPTWKDLSKLFSFIRSIPYRKTCTDATKDDSRVDAFRDEHPLQLDRFVPEPMYYGPN